MQNKKFVRLNIDDNHLSLGNFIRIIKENSTSSASFYQSDLFCIIFNLDSTIADSTVNNYCTGFRKINNMYKNYYVNLKEDYKKNNLVLLPTILNILNTLYENKTSLSTDSLKYINNDKKLKEICEKLYYISKNDVYVPSSFSEILYKHLQKNNLYEFICQVLFYIIIDKKQPIQIDESLNNIIEKNIYGTNISLNSIEDYVNIQLNSSIWSIRAIFELAKNNNPFACFEIASLEFFGVISGCPRYEKAYEYYKIAESSGHPTATWAIGYLYYNGYIGSKSKHDLYLAFKYFNKARKLKCSNAFNSLGLIILNGNIPHIKPNEKLACYYFEKAVLLGNVYGYNNLGKIYENKKEYNKAFYYFNKASDVSDSYAQNKMGEYYRLGLGCKKDLKKSYEYYLESSNSCKFTLCVWSKYNLAKYFYKYGVPEIGIKKDIKKSVRLLEEISDCLIEALEELIYIHYELYLKSKKDENIKKKVKLYITKLECMENYDENIKKRVSITLKELFDTNHIILPDEK